MEEKVNRSQFALLICISLHFAIVAINHTKPTFQNYTPHSTRCTTSNVTSTSKTSISSSRNQNKIFNISKPTGCTESCTTIYKTSEPLVERHEVTIVSEWHLTHKESKWNSLVVSLYFLGVVLGSLPVGLCADRFGRRVVMLTCFYCQGALSLAIVYVHSFTLYAVLRTLQGFFVQGLQNSSYTLLIELFPTRWRISVAWITEICWALGLVLLGLVSYWFPNWREAELVTSLPFILFSFLYVWFIPESPLWRYTRNKIIDFEYLCDDESHRNSLNEYTHEPGGSHTHRGLTYLSSENFIVQHINNPIHSQTMPDIRTHLMTLNHSFTSAKTDVNVSDDFLTENLDSYGSIEDLRVSLSSIMCEFDLTIEQFRNSYLIDLKEEKKKKKSIETPCMRRGSKIINTTKDSADDENYLQDTLPSKDLLPLSVTCPPVSYHSHGDLYHPPGEIPLYSASNEDTVAIARDKLLRQLNKCVWRECCKRKTLDELLLLLEQKRLTRHDVRNVCREICDNRPIRTRLLIMCYLWFSTSLSYYGVTFSVPALSGNRFQNFCYGAGFEFVFFSLSFFVLSKVGRKVPLIAFYIISSCLFVFVFAFAVHLTACIRTFIVLLGKGTIVGTFFCVFIYCAELFPTPMRGACNGITSLCCRIGSLLSPYFITYTIKLSPDTMLLLIGLLSLLAAFLTLCLPETHLKKLPDTLDDALNLNSSRVNQQVH